MKCARGTATPAGLSQTHTGSQALDFFTRGNSASSSWHHLITQLVMKPCPNTGSGFRLKHIHETVKAATVNTSAQTELMFSPHSSCLTSGLNYTHTEYRRPAFFWDSKRVIRSGSDVSAGGTSPEHLPGHEEEI